MQVKYKDNVMPIIICMADIWMTLLLSYDLERLVQPFLV